MFTKIEKGELITLRHFNGTLAQVEYCGKSNTYITVCWVGILFKPLSDIQLRPATKRSPLDKIGKVVRTSGKPVRSLWSIPPEDIPILVRRIYGLQTSGS